VACCDAFVGRIAALLDTSCCDMLFEALQQFAEVGLGPQIS
jgi:hypothetical protein